MNNLYAISGRIAAGKDLTGQMIQYLTDPYAPNTFTQWKFAQHLAPYTKYEIKKFADKLKDIVCLLIGCTRKQLEDRDFKERLLGEEWQGYQVSWNLPNNQWEGYFKTEEEALKYLNDDGAETTLESAYIDNLIRKIELTPRLLLQLLGTECGRNIIHPNIWVNSLFADYKPEKGIIDAWNKFCPISENVYDIRLKNKELGKYDENIGGVLTTIYPNWIITDVRFPNEVQAIKERGGINIRIIRPCPLCAGMDFHKINCKIGWHEHESEKALDNFKDWDYVIENNGTINDLLEKVKLIVK